MKQRLRMSNGFTLIDMVVVMTLIGILSAMAIPAISDIGNRIALGEAQRLVQSELQRARLKAVTSNRVMRVRFNCPVNGAVRMVELIGTPSAPASQDTASNRCSDAAYPYPAVDTNPVTLPNQDGPIRRIDRRVSFGSAQTIEFRPTGAAYSVNADGTSSTPLAGTGVSITLTKGPAARAVTVNALGKIQAQ